jgi:hypothetical protein
MGIHIICIKIKNPAKPAFGGMQPSFSAVVGFSRPTADTATQPPNLTSNRRFKRQLLPTAV